MGHHDLINVHQTPFALAALSLFQQTREIKYEIFCRYVYNKLLSWQDKNGLLPYFANTKSEIDFYFVDQLGMYVPFLVRYAKEFDDKSSHFWFHSRKIVCDCPTRWIIG